MDGGIETYINSVLQQSLVNLAPQIVTRKFCTGICTRQVLSQSQSNDCGPLCVEFKSLLPPRQSFIQTLEVP